jgi:hypothetical protein
MVFEKKTGDWGDIWSLEVYPNYAKVERLIGYQKVLLKS